MVGGIVTCILLPIVQIMLLFQVCLFSGFFLFKDYFKFIPSLFKSRTDLR